MKKILYLLVLSCMLCACMDKIDSRELTVVNESEKSIFSVLSDNDIMGSSSYYSDFQVKQNSDGENSSEKFRFEEIHPNSRQTNHDRPKDWKSFFENIEDKKARVFIISKDSVDKYGWKKIFKDQIFNKKYIFTIEELNDPEWKIVYK